MVLILEKVERLCTGNVIVQYGLQVINLLEHIYTLALAIIDALDRDLLVARVVLVLVRELLLVPDLLYTPLALQL